MYKRQEQGDSNLGACLKCGGLCDVGGCIAAEAGLCLCDDQVDKQGGLQAEDVALVGQDLYNRVLLDVYKRQVYIWDMFPAAVDAAVKILEEKMPGVELIPCQTAEEAVKDADIVCTVTSTKGDAPFLKGEWLKEMCIRDRCM